MLKAKEMVMGTFENLKLIIMINLASPLSKTKLEQMWTLLSLTFCFC